MSPAPAPIVFRTADNSCEITIHTGAAPELTDWARQKLVPALAEWYPKIVAMLPGEGFRAPGRFTILLLPGDGVAYTSGTRVVANSTWLATELNGQAVGALVHESVHVVQQYGHGPQQPPGWLVEGMADYIRFFKFEPQQHGADIEWLKGHRKTPLNYDGSYRISANFLDYVARHYDPDHSFLRKLNAACRGGAYTEELWKELTGKTLQELNGEWKADVQQQLGDKADPGK